MKEDYFKRFLNIFKNNARLLESVVAEDWELCTAATDLVLSQKGAPQTYLTSR